MSDGMKTPVKCPVCGADLPELTDKTMTICRRCGVGVDMDVDVETWIWTANPIHPPAGYELVEAGTDVIAGDIHYCTWIRKWDFEYPIFEERITTDHYPLIARPARKREPGAGEQLTLF